MESIQWLFKEGWRMHWFVKCAALAAALLGCVLVTQGGAAWVASEEEAPKPAESLVHAVNLLLYEMDVGVRTKFYDQTAREKIARQSATAAVLVMALSQEQDPTALGQAADTFVPIAERLAESPDNQAAAAQTITRLRKLAANPPAGEKIEARPVSKLGLLMQQVPEFNNGLRRDMGSDDPAKQRAANQAALAMSAVASVAAHDLSRCKDAGDEIAWRAYCEELRLSAAEIREALVVQDRATAFKGLARLTKSCDSCHAEFRD